MAFQHCPCNYSLQFPDSMQDPEEANSESTRASERNRIAQLLSFRGSLRSDVSRLIIVIKVLFCIGWAYF